MPTETLRFVIVNAEVGTGEFVRIVRHALPLGQGADDAEATLCSEARPAQGWKASGFTSLPELISCLACREQARAAIREAHPIG